MSNESEVYSGNCVKCGKVLTYHIKEERGEKSIIYIQPCACVGYDDAATSTFPKENA